MHTKTPNPDKHSLKLSSFSVNYKYILRHVNSDTLHHVKISP